MTGLRRNYKLAKKEILTLWEAEYPLRAAFSYVATRELLRRDAGIATSRRRKKGIGREHGGRFKKVKRSKGQKSHLTKVKKWKWIGECEYGNIKIIKYH